MMRTVHLFITVIVSLLCNDTTLAKQAILSTESEKVTIYPDKSADNPKAINELLNRIGGKGANKRFITRLDKGLSQNGKDIFCISSKNGKPYIEGSSITAISTGLNWYLNHYAHINLSWNQLTTDLKKVTLPLPKNKETHQCNADYRYYLNYCTFGYSMTPWTWERWEKEIDWMALHGVNMPLQIIGIEKVWKEFLMLDYGYSEEEAEDFVAGPAFIAWWGMNNLEGWSGTHDDAWYDRQAELGRKICKRERELGMQPVLPGFSGMIPSNFEEKTGKETEQANLWCHFQRPAILSPTGNEFANAAQKYYRRLTQVLGTSQYYSMDPFHEGGSISSGKYSEGYKAVFDAMNTNCGEDTQWVIQQWQWSNHQATSLTAVPSGRLIVLDLYSDGQPAFEHYNGYAPQHAIYCTIPNFGGRTGFMGRLSKLSQTYFAFKNQYNSIKGIGAAPEAIESVPIVYDLLFELPWMEKEPSVSQWMKEYVRARYGTDNADAQRAWQTILATAMNEATALQGPHESVMCARPDLSVEHVSTWGGCNIFYDRQQLIVAAKDLLKASETIGTKGSIGAENMSYDLTDVVRQCLSDYSKDLLTEIKYAYEHGDMTRFNHLRTTFLDLIIDTDRLLGTNRMFRLGNWTSMARNAAKEVKGATTATPDWLELCNARTLITTWGDWKHSEYGGLRDYSYRQWQGMLRDYYYPRWKYWFEHDMQAPENGWFYSEWNWAHELEGEWGANEKGRKMKEKRTYYTPEPEGDSQTIAKEIMQKYMGEKQAF